MTRDELRAKEWAAIAVQYHRRMKSKGQPIPFPDVCFCNGFAHKRSVVMNNNHAKRQVDVVPCPVISKKVHALRVKAIGEAINAG